MSNQSSATDSIEARDDVLSADRRPIVRVAKYASGRKFDRL